MPLSAIERLVDSDRLRPWNQRLPAEPIAYILTNQCGRKVNAEKVSRYLAPTVDPRRPAWDGASDLRKRILGAKTGDVLFSVMATDIWLTLFQPELRSGPNR